MSIRASWWALAAFLVFVAACAGPVNPPPLVTDAVLDDACPERVILYGTPRGHKVLRTIPALGAYVVCSNSGLEARIDAERDEVRQWIPEDLQDAPSAQADPWSQWHLEKMQAEEAWSISTGEGVTVYVLDTAGNCGSMHMNCGRGRNYVGGSSSDAHGHGSHVGSTIGELLNASRGVGVAHSATVAFYKVLSDSGSGSVSGIAAAMTDAADACPGKCIISMSLGSSQSSDALTRAAAYAISKGVPVIAAGGNHGTTAPGYPGCSPGVIGVGATDINDRIASFSARGSCIDLAGPGVNITASRPSGQPWTISGTSMATPNVSAVAALLLSLGASPTDIERLLEETADDIGGQGLGAGRVNALAAVRAVNAPAPTPNKTALPEPVTAEPPATNAPAPTGEPVHKHCEGRALVSVGEGFRLMPVLVPCPDGR